MNQRFLKAHCRVTDVGQCISKTPEECSSLFRGLVVCRLWAQNTFLKCAFKLRIMFVCVWCVMDTPGCVDLRRQGVWPQTGARGYRSVRKGKVGPRGAVEARERGSKCKGFLGFAPSTNSQEPRKG